MFSACGASPLTFSAVSTYISSFGAVTVGFSICQRADPAILTGVLCAKAHHLQADFLTIDKRGQLTSIIEVCNNSLEWWQLTDRGLGDGRFADVPREPSEEEVADDLHELTLGPHLFRLGLAIHGQASPQIVPVDGCKVPAAVVDHFVRGDGGLGAVDAHVKLQLTLRYHEKQEVAVSAVVKVEHQAFWFCSLELKCQVTSGAGVPAQVPSPLALGASKLKAYAQAEHST